MIYLVPKELAAQKSFREQLSKAYKEHGAVLTWVGTHEYTVVNFGIVGECK